MNNFLFYVLTVLIWGSTWIAIKFQLGMIDPVVSVTYRFGLAAAILLIWCRFFNLRMRFSLKDHFTMALQGAFLFAINYMFFYTSELHLTSGLAAVIFSMILIMNMINGAIFLGTPFNSRVIAGGCLGLTGIVMVFRPELDAFSFGDKGFYGFILCLVGTFLASIGNILSAYNQRKKLPVIQTNAYGMAYGAILMMLIALLTGKEFGFVFSAEYIGSLFYLAIFGSIIAFGCYLTLIGNIGADRAAYATLLFPLVALGISTVWEGYQWSGSALSGVLLIISGNLLMLKKRKKKPEMQNEMDFPDPGTDIGPDPGIGSGAEKVLAVN